MHIYTHLKAASQGKTGLGLEADGMTELDGYVGQLLKQLDDLGIVNNTLSYSPPIMVPRSSHGPTAGPHHSEVRKTQTGKVATASPP
jgi:hypothetical protein